MNSGTCDEDIRNFVQQSYLSKAKAVYWVVYDHIIKWLNHILSLAYNSQIYWVPDSYIEKQEVCFGIEKCVNGL